MTSPKLLTAPELAEILRKRTASIRSDACRAPHRLPPRTVLPGNRLLLWDAEDVQKWLAEHKVEV